MYKKKGEAGGLSAWGISDADYESHDTVLVLPDNWEPVLLFLDLSTQWRTGAVGATGLDYGVLPDIFRIRGIAKKRWSDLMDDIQVMEGAALKTMSEKK